jgi:hypothetical protein
MLGFLRPRVSVFKTSQPSLAEDLCCLNGITSPTRRQYIKSFSKEDLILPQDQKGQETPDRKKPLISQQLFIEQLH